jgi:hypothetical protein
MALAGGRPQFAAFIPRTPSRFMRRLFVVADYECARDVIEDITDAGLKITQPNTSTRSVQSAEKALNS